MTTVRVCRQVRLPDPVRAALCRKVPELGPRILFFSGGSALRDLARSLVDGTHNSIHLVTPFDSGGSSAKLRQAFDMPAIGDARARVMALADQSVRGTPEVYDLFAHRLPADAPREELVRTLDRMVRGKHTLVARVPDPMRHIIRTHLQTFAEAMPEDFDLAGASIGNLVLTAGYLTQRRMLDPVLYLFSRLVQARGEVRPVVGKGLHVAARLEDGRVVVGQHRITGKESAPLTSRIREVFFTACLDSAEPVGVDIRRKTAELIASADLICYPMGSFYTSVLVNLLPGGVPEAVASNPCPKVYVPGTGEDPETLGMDLADQVETLLEVLRRPDPDRIKPQDVLQFVLVDRRNGRYRGGVDFGRIRKLGVEPVDLPLVTQPGATRIDGHVLADILLSLA